jgi:hypothetical protein
MNESVGASVMHDRSGHKRRGRIGPLVMTGQTDGDITGYQFTSGPKDIDRLVLVDSPALNPNRSTFKVVLRLKTSMMDQNIIQKGQANTAGGSWKVETDVDGHVVCTFRGAAGRGAVGSRGIVADGNWHQIVCIRRPTEVVIIVGKSIPRRDRGRTGNISNSAQLTIGGKKSCTASAVSCQYYDGMLDRVAVSKRR